MKSNDINIIFILLGTFFFSSCGTDITTGFLMNGQDILSSEIQPEDLEKEEQVLSVYVGDSIIFTDISTPEKNIKIREWDVDGNPGMDNIYENKKHFAHFISKEGIQEIKLCINGNEHCASKWINARPYGLPPSGDPVVSYAYPSELYSSTDQAFIDIKVNTENVFSKDELNLYINGDSRGFKFDETTGIITKPVQLAKGENKIEVQANTGDKIVSEWVIITYEKGNGNGPKPKPYVNIVSPQPYYSSPNENISLVFKTANISKENGFSVKLNGASVRNSKYDNRKKRWGAKLVLNEGSNTVEVKSRDGKAKDRLTLFYEPIPDVAPEVPSPTPTPPPAPPPAPLPPSPDPTPPPSSTPNSPMVKILAPSVKPDKQGSIEVSFNTTNLVGPRDLQVKLNDQKISGLRFDSNRKVWVGKLNLKPGNNKVEATVQNGNGSSRDQISIDYENNDIPFSNLGEIGFPTSAYIDNCAKANVTNYTFSLTPKKSVKLLEFKLYSNICGGLEIILQSENGLDRTKVELIKGKNQIPLSDLNTELDVGTKYTFSLKTIAGFGFCDATATPQLEDASSCTYQAINKPELIMDSQGKSIIYDLKYLY